MSGDDCINSLWIGPARLRDEGLPWVEESIEAAFSKNKDKRKKYQKKFREIREISDQLENKIIEFENLLKKNTTPSEGINLKTWIDIRDKLREQEEKN